MIILLSIILTQIKKTNYKLCVALARKLDRFEQVCYNNKSQRKRKFFGFWVIPGTFKNSYGKEERK